MERTAVERGRMKHDDELTIQENMHLIEEELEPRALTGALFTRKILDMDDMQRIEAGETRLKRAKLFLKIIMNRGTGSYKAFLECLEEKGYANLATKLRERKPATENKKILHFLSVADKLNAMEKELRETKKKIAELEGMVASLEKKDASLVRHIESQDKEINNLKRELQENFESQRRNQEELEETRRRDREEMEETRRRNKEREFQKSKTNTRRKPQPRNRFDGGWIY